MPTITSLTSTSGSFRLLPNTSDVILAFDIETDGLLYDKQSPVTQVWCVVIFDCKTKTFHKYRPGEIDKALEHLSNATILIGHNIISYDVPVLQSLYPAWKCSAQLIDTLTLSSLVYPKDKLMDLDETDFHNVESKLRGSQSLRAWGQRLANLKGDHTDWSQFTEEMLDYCQGDVLVTVTLYSYLIKSLKQSDPELSNLKSISLEHDIAQILTLQMNTGWGFDVDSGLDLSDQLRARLNELEAAVLETIPPTIERTTFIPKRDNKNKGYLAGVPFIKEKTIPFNPGSRPQILAFFKEKYQWVPKEITKKGNPKLNDDILGDLNYPEAKLLTEYFLLQKRLSQLADGDKSWLGLVNQNNVIHGSIIANGCVTGRSTHIAPNLAQVPNAGSQYGPECRRLFKPLPGFTLLGSDAKALELRCLGGYLAHYDNGDYASKVIDPEVDIHTYNQEKFGVNTRDIAKRLIYCVPVKGTEILTIGGWQPYEKLRVGDVVSTYNQDTQQKEWKPILEIVHPFNERVWEINNGRGFKAKSTASHRWFTTSVYSPYKKIIVKTTEELSDGDLLIVDVPAKGNDIGCENLLRFDMGVQPVFCISTENGSFIMKQNNCVTITGNCVLYGGGPTKTGSIIEPSASPDRQKSVGIEALDKFYAELPALKKLKDNVETAINERGYLKGLDGRQLYVRSAYKGLNLLLQSAGAIIMKRVGIEIYEGMTAAGLVYGVDWNQNAYVHDEYQNGVLPHHVEKASVIIKTAYKKAGEYLNFRCPIEGDVKVGTNWMETH